MPGRQCGSRLFYGAALLSLGSVAMRCVQMVFQIYLSGVLGPAGLGRMHLILTVAGFGAVLASGGVRVGATCLSAEEADNPPQVRAAVRCCVIYGLALSCLSALTLGALSPLLSRLVLTDETAAPSLRLLALFLPAGCLWSVFAGYYTASGRISELVALELAERICAIILVAGLMALPAGHADPCFTVFLGSSLATLGSLAVLLLRYLHFVRNTPAAPLRPMLRRLLRLCLPVGFNDTLRSGLSALEHALIPSGLRRFGSSGDEAMAAYGTIGGMVFPVITFPNIILYALSDLLVPEMARSRALHRAQRIRTLTDRCLRLTALFSLCIAGLCFLLGDDLGMLLFSSPTAGQYIRVFAPLIPMLYVDAVADGILKGLSQQLYTARYNTFTSLIDLALLVILLPRRGIGGFLAAYTISHGINFFLSLRRLMVVSGDFPRFRTTLRAGLCCAGTVMILQMFPLAGGVLATVWRGLGFVLLYCVLIRLSGALPREEIRWLRGLILGADS